jgi:hypothetical protein
VNDASHNAYLGTAGRCRPQDEAPAKAFHATVHVTRVEEWYLEAESEQEARELLASGGGFRTNIGDCVNLEVESVED